MSYYGRGDYYGGMRGDYYRGDPFLGGLLAKAIPLVGRAGGAVIRGGKRILGIGGKTAPGLPGMPAVPMIPKIGRKVGAAVGAGATVATVGGMLPDFEFGSAPRRRRMNVTNVKALKRAIRRAEGFEKIARRTVNALHRGPKKFKLQRRAS